MSVTISRHHPRTPVFERGDFFLERYRIYKHLGTGGFGQVYYAYDAHECREVAVKIATRSALRKEAALLKSISHPHVPAYYADGTTAEGSYLIMEYICGQTLSDLLHTPGTAASLRQSGQCYDIALQLISVLAFLHDEHTPTIIFRDLKPSNIIIKKTTNKPYLVDFGIACFDPSEGYHLPLQHRSLGTPGYIAPEVLSQQDISLAMDIYALGATLYQLLTGTLPEYCSCKQSRCVCGRYPHKKLHGPLGRLVMLMLEENKHYRPPASALKTIIQDMISRREAEAGNIPPSLFTRFRHSCEGWVPNRY